MENLSNIKVSKRWLSKKILCGFCNFYCCNSKTFHVEITEKEQGIYKEKFNKILPLRWSIMGHCNQLTKSGCSLGEDRPIYCKLFPIQKNKSGRLIVSNWSMFHCPKPKNYELISVEGGKYHYKAIKKHPNIRPELILNGDIEEIIQPIYIQLKQYLIQEYSQDVFDNIKQQIGKII